MYNSKVCLIANEFPHECKQKAIITYKNVLSVETQIRIFNVFVIKFIKQFINLDEDRFDFNSKILNFLQSASYLSEL